MRVLVTGGRDYRDWSAFMRTMDALQAERPITLLMHGDHHSGADPMTMRYALVRGIPCAGMKPHWQTMGKPAGPRRNGWMVDLLFPDMAVAFPGGSGTADCVRRARAAGIEVREVQP